MANLREGHKYSLSTEEKKSKSVIFVKLTDSAVQSIESFLNSKDDSSVQPSIQFQNNSGVISLPFNGDKQNYGFTISNIEGDGLQSSFQCIQDTDNNSLESLGFIFKKMQIHATEDSYEKTKCKVAAADQEQKNLCTKQLDPNVSRLGNKVKVKRPGLVYVPEKTQSSIVKPEPAKLNPKSKETSPSQKPIRERIIHILAAKPYKKAELLLRLKKEGISDEDKDKINTILVEVAKVKGKILTLEDAMWNEVQDDWQFYSSEELQFIKKKKDQFVKPNNMNGSTGQFVKPNNMNGSSGPSVKQKGAVSTPQIPFNKKQNALPNAHKKNNSCQNDSSVTTIGNGKKNVALGLFQSLQLFNKTRNNLDLMSKPISPICSRKKFPVKKKNKSTSNGTMQASETSPFQNSITPLKTSFVLSENRSEETNGKCEETMSVNKTNHGNEIHQPKCKFQRFSTVDDEMSVDGANNSNEIRQPQHKTQSLSNIDAEMSVCNQIENDQVSQIQVKQSNNCSETTIHATDNSSLSVFNNKTLHKPLVNGASSLSHKSGNESHEKMPVSICFKSRAI